MPRLLVAALAVLVLLLAACGGDDEPKRLSKAEYGTVTGFFGASVDSPEQGQAACDKVKAAPETKVVKTLERYCTEGVRIQRAVFVTTVGVRRFCDKPTNANCVRFIKGLRAQYVRIERLLEAYNKGIEGALAQGDCRSDLRDTDASRMGPFLDNMDTAVAALGRGDINPLQQLGALPDQDPNSDLKSCQGT